MHTGTLNHFPLRFNMMPDVLNGCSTLFIDGNFSVDGLCVSISLLLFSIYFFLPLSEFWISWRETLTRVGFGKAVMLMSQRAASQKHTRRILASHLIRRHMKLKPFNWNVCDRRSPAATWILFPDRETPGIEYWLKQPPNGRTES